VVTCPALPRSVTEDDTLEEARAMAEDAIRGSIESLRNDHLPIPSDKAPVKEDPRVGARAGVSRRLPVRGRDYFSSFFFSCGSLGLECSRFTSGLGGGGPACGAGVT
jgi:predicted RNase H-like HicB family nuclease